MTELSIDELRLKALTHSLLKRLKESQLEALLASVETKGGADAECVLLPKSDLRMGKNSLRFEFSSAATGIGSAAESEDSASGGSDGAAASASPAASWPIPPHVFVCLLWRWPDLKLHFDAEGEEEEELRNGGERTAGSCRCCGGQVPAITRSTVATTTTTMTTTIPCDGAGDEDEEKSEDIGEKEAESDAANERHFCRCRGSPWKSASIASAASRTSLATSNDASVSRVNYELRPLPVCRTRSASHVCVNPYHWARLYEPGMEGKSSHQNQMTNKSY